MFAIKMYHAPRVTTYEEAAAVYDRAKPKPSGPVDARHIPGKHNSPMHMRPKNGGIAFCYHDTDVITRYPDGSYDVVINGWDSASTAQFASHFMPQGHHLTRKATILTVGGWYYPIGGASVHVDKDGSVSGSLRAFVRTTVNRKRGRELLNDLGYSAYQNWYMAMAPLVRGTLPPLWKREYVTDRAAEEMLANPDLWHALMMSQLHDLKDLRNTLYEAFGYKNDIWDKERLSRIPDTANYTRYSIE